MIILLAVGFASIPTFLVHGIEQVNPTLANNETLYTIGIPKIAIANHCFLFKSNLWLTGILFKVIKYSMIKYDPNFWNLKI